jgi:hypothetical protein
VVPAQGDPPASTLAYLAFDLLYLDGKSLLSLQYADRRQQLERLNLSGPSWWTPPFTLDGAQLLEESQALYYEGVIAKKLASPYRPGFRTRDWLKVKVPRRELVVIAAWMPSDIHADRIGSLVLGRYDVARSVDSAPGEAGTGRGWWPRNRPPGHGCSRLAVGVLQEGSVGGLESWRRGLVAEVIELSPPQRRVEANQRRRGARDRTPGGLRRLPCLQHVRCDPADPDRSAAGPGQHPVFKIQQLEGG